MVRDQGTKATARLRRLSPWLLLALGGLAALILAGGMVAGLQWTETEAFCISCHEMEKNVYAEFKGTPHDYNASGVRATCADCHVPREPVDLIIRKIRASAELYGKLTGIIDTREKFEEHRFTMAKRVWARMKKTDSRECRNCHTETAMRAELQSARAQTRHERAKREHLTCIDCHFAIAHKEPPGPGPREIDFDAE